MPRKRLSGAERRTSILQAASAIFAEYGFDAARTQQIARAAKVSEALVYRHFPTKLALYKAVLRELIHEQDKSLMDAGFAEPNTNSMIQVLETYLRSCTEGSSSPAATGNRVMFASMAGDGDYARLIYKRALKRGLKPFKDAFEAAREAGDVTGPELSPVNLHAFIQHVGSMIMVAHLPDKPIIQYEGDKERILKDALRFVCRGIGVTDAALSKYLVASGKRRTRATG